MFAQRYLVSFSIALAGSLLFTVLIRILSRRFGFVAKPRQDRWHKKPTSLFGGVAIFMGFAVAYLVCRPSAWGQNGLLITCCAGMFLVGLIDDFVQLKPYAKLVAQIVISTVFTTFGLRLHWLPSAVLDQALTIFWLVGITNALNLLDNLDGLAGGIAAIAAGYLVYFCHMAGQPSVAALAAAFVGAVVGFLVFNFNPASIFMGDCGSLFLGFFLGGVSLVNNQPGLRRNVIAILAIPVLLLLIPIIDTSLVTVSRKLNGRSVSQGGRDHTSHRLVALGLSERGAALTLWTLALASGAVAVLVRNLSWPVAGLIVPLFGMGLLLFLTVVAGVRVYSPVEGEGADVKGRALLPTLADFTYKRRILEVLNDLVMIVVAYYAAFLLRFDGSLLAPYYARFALSLPLVIAVQLAAMLALGLYRGLWRYTSMSDLIVLGRAVGGAWIASIVAVAFVLRLDGFSRGMLMMDGILLLVGVAGSRVSLRLIRTWIADLKRAPTGSRRVLIYGAGDGGELLVREMQNNRALGLFPIGFVDDDPQKEGRVIHGVRVLGPLARLSELATAERAEELVISTNSLATERNATVTDLCQTAGIACRRMRIAFD